MILMSFTLTTERKLVPVLALLMATGMVAGCALPAFASNTDEVQATTYKSAETQSVVVSAQAVADVVTRDEFSITEPAPVVETASATNRYTGAAPSSIYSGGAVLAYAEQFIGVVPYGNGNSPDDSFSCDGFVQYVLSGFGISVPRGANSIASYGVAISPSDAVAGDLLWWPGQHIAFYDGAGGMYDSPDWGKYVQHRSSIWGEPVYIRLV